MIGLMYDNGLDWWGESEDNEGELIVLDKSEYEVLDQEDE